MTSVETPPHAPAPRWQPVLATRDHLPAIHALHRLIWGPGKSQAYLAWKLFDAPFDPIPPVVAMDGDLCAGIYAVISTPLILDGQMVMGAQSVDTMTHPDYRRQNMSVTLAKVCYAEAARRDFRLVYGLPNENSYPMFMKRLHWRHADEVVRMVRPLAAPARVPRLLAPPLDAALALQARLDAMGTVAGAPQPVGPATRFVLPQVPPSAARCVVDKSAAWFAWRYGAEPEGRHEQMVLGDPARPDALIIFDKVADDSDPRSRPLIRISEWLGRTDASRLAVLRALVGEAARRGCASLTTFTNDPVAIALLRRAQFFPREGMPLCLGGLGAFKDQVPVGKGELVVFGGDKD